MLKINSRGSFLFNVLWNLLGAGGPSLIALLCIPTILSKMGMERYGVLSIIWMLIGYFGIFDMGIGRAMTKIMSELILLDDKNPARRMVRTGLSCVAGVGLVISFLLYLFIHLFFGDIFKVGLEIQTEARYSIYVMILVLPFVVLSAALIGILEACSEFKLLNGIKLILGTMSFILPLLVLNFTSSLLNVTVSLAMLRLISTLIYGYALWRRRLLSLGAISRVDASQLLRFGAWVTVSNFISPLMSQLDKFFLAALVSISVLPYYTVPSDIVGRLDFLPSAVIGVLFPFFVQSISLDKTKIAKIFENSVLLMLWPGFILMLGICFFSETFLMLWLGEEFSMKATLIFKLLAVGLFFNCLAKIPFIFIQGIDRPDITTKVHLVEFPLYAISLWILLDKYGVLGAALAWAFRMALDCFSLFACAAYIHSELRKISSRIIFFSIGSSFLVIFFSTNLNLPIELKALLFAGISVLSFYFGRRNFLKISNSY